MTAVRQLLDQKGRNIWSIHPDATVFDAIAKMALENYVEMREAVLDPEYRRRKKAEEELATRDPNFISRYAKVMFHPEISYSDASRRSAG